MSYIDPLLPEHRMAVYKFVGKLSRRPILERTSESALMRFSERHLGLEDVSLYRRMETAKRECQLSGHGDRKWAYLWDTRIILLLATKLFQCSSRPSCAPWHLQHARYLVIRATDTFVDSIGEDTEGRMRGCEHE